jgi:catechol-2,3-dioxygenase
MVSAIKLGHAGIVSRNYEAMLDYYTGVLGLKLIEQTATTSYLRVGLDHHAIALYKGDNPGLRHIAFQIDPKYSAADAVKDLSDAGISAHVETDSVPGISELVTFSDFDGMRVELYANVSFASRIEKLTAIAPLKLGHVARGVVDVKGICGYYENHLGFRVSDWMEDFFVFMRCGPEHHTINFIRAPAPYLHHVAFQVSDWAHIQRSCDILAENNIPLIWGPVRHGIGHNVSIYHRDPDGGRVELFCEMDMMLDERLGYFEPRPWHEDIPQRPKVWKTDTMRARNIWGIPEIPSNQNAVSPNTKHETRSVDEEESLFKS